MRGNQIIAKIKEVVDVTVHFFVSLEMLRTFFEIGYNERSEICRHILSKEMWMRSSRVVGASDSQCRSRNCPMGSIPGSSDRAESEGRQMKQC
jgi:hypothetical protein